MAPAVALAADPDTYSAAPIHGWVVDAETKQPLEGVHVVAQWILQTGLLHGEHSTRLHIMETVTDQSGAYHFPGWGPKPRPFLARFDGFDPMLTFFKPGHVPLDRTNFDPPQDRRASNFSLGREDDRAAAVPGHPAGVASLSRPHAGPSRLGPGR